MRTSLQSQSRQLQIEICMLSAVQCDSLISLKGAFHSEGSIGRSTLRNKINRDTGVISLACFR